MRFNDAARNRAIFNRLGELGFELVRALSVWSYKILDCVFLRKEHFDSAIESNGNKSAKPSRASEEPSATAMHGEHAELATSKSAAAADHQSSIPHAAFELLRAQRRNHPRGVNRKWVLGRAGGYYAVSRAMREPL